MSALVTDLCERGLQDEVLVIPLHRQVIPWVSRANVVVTHRANNVLQPFTVKIQ